MKYEAWAMLSAESCGDTTPEFHSFEVDADCACDARKNARQKVFDVLQALGFQAEIVKTNKHEVAVTLPDGKEIIYIVDVN